MTSSTRTTRSAAPEHGTAATLRGTGPTPDPAAEPSGMLALGRYRLYRPLGAGGFGSVWLARDERLERDVAVKVLPRERIIGGRFEREARAAARLSHPGIVTLYEAAVDDDGAYLVSELVAGSTLAGLLEAGRLSDRDIVAIGIALCDALEHAHAQGVVHRDVKPSNVLVPESPASPAGVAKLTDFGVARLIGGNPLTRTGDVVGTAAYMAPEQAEAREVDGTADLYSLSLVLYEALTGVNPIVTGTAAGRARRLGAHLPPLRRQRRHLPRELGRSIDLALRPRPRERGGLGELRSGLAASLDEVDDLPGVVEAPWPRVLVNSRPSPSQGLGGLGEEGPGEVGPGEDPFARGEPRAHAQGGPNAQGEPKASAPRPHWPQRSLSAAAAALIAAWLTATVFRSLPLPPTVAALTASLAVLALPRIGWLALTLAAGAALSAEGKVGGALIVVSGALVPVLLLPRHPTRWPLPVLAPALGVALIAGAWPALAGQDKTAWRRATLGAIGWIWTSLAGLLAGHAVYARLPAGTPRGSAWTGSVEQTVSHVLQPLLRSGLLIPAAIWALAATILPWITRGSVGLRLGLTAVWAAALASATAAALPHMAGGAAVRPGVLVLGAAAAWLIAAVPALIKRPQSASPSPDPAPDLA